MRSAWKLSKTLSENPQATLPGMVQLHADQLPTRVPQGPAPMQAVILEMTGAGNYLVSWSAKIYWQSKAFVVACHAKTGITDFKRSLPHIVMPLQAHPDPPQVDLASAAAIGAAAGGQCPPCGGAPPLGHSALATFVSDWCHESCNSPKGYKKVVWWL